MTTFQKVIKYLALGFAAFLIFLIVSGVFGILSSFSSVLGLQKEDNVIADKINERNFKDTEINSLDIEVAFTNLIVKKGTSLQMKTNQKNIHFEQNNQKLQIKEKNHQWFSKDNKGSLVIYVPDDLVFENIKINAGVGKIQIENMNTKKLSLMLGAGETTIDKLMVTDKCKIESGAGKVSILSGNINQFDLEVGIGDFEATALVTGNSKINAGIGNLELTLQGSKKDYQIQAEKGVGTIKIGDKKVEDNYSYGNGDNLIKLEGGIGNIHVHFEEK